MQAIRIENTLKYINSYMKTLNIFVHLIFHFSFFQQLLRLSLA